MITKMIAHDKYTLKLVLLPSPTMAKMAKTIINKAWTISRPALSLVSIRHFSIPYVPTKIPDIMLMTAPTPIMYVGFSTDSTFTNAKTSFRSMRNVYLGLFSE